MLRQRKFSLTGSTNSFISDSFANKLGVSGLVLPVSMALSVIHSEAERVVTSERVSISVKSVYADPPICFDIKPFVKKVLD